MSADRQWNGNGIGDPSGGRLCSLHCYLLFITHYDALTTHNEFVHKTGDPRLNSGGTQAVGSAPPAAGARNGSQERLQHRPVSSLDYCSEAVADAM